MARDGTNHETLSIEALSLLLRRATRHVSDQISDALEPLEISSREYAVLALLDEYGPMSQQAASKLLCVDRTSMVVLVDRLEQADLLKRERKRGDRRIHQLVLSGAGDKLRRRASRALQDTARRVLDRLGDKDRRRLKRALEAVLADAASVANDEVE